MIARRERRDGLGQFTGERGTVGCRPETDLGVDRQGRQALAGIRGGALQCPDLPHQPGAERDEVARRQAVGATIRIDADRAEGARRDDIGGGARHHQPLRQPAPLARVGNLDKPVLLQRVQVVIRLLPLEAEPGRERRGRGGFLQFGQELAPDGLERGYRHACLIDDFNIEHVILTLTNFPVNAIDKHVCQQRKAAGARVDHDGPGGDARAELPDRPCLGPPGPSGPRWRSRRADSAGRHAGSPAAF